jgi:hypothetical protein
MVVIACLRGPSQPPGLLDNFAARGKGNDKRKRQGKRTRCCLQGLGLGLNAVS